MIFGGKYMKIFFRVLFFVLGAALFLNGAVMALVANFNLGIVLTVLLGLFFLMCGAFYEKIKLLTASGFLRAVKYAVFAGVIFLAALTAFLAIYGECDDAEYDEDAVIVLGAGLHGKTPSLPLAMRLDAAERYYRKNPGALIVVSGGQGFQEDITEAEAMREYLAARGVSEENIIEEGKSTSTFENMTFSKKILDERLGEDYSCVIITNNFHIYRAVKIAGRAGLKNAAHYHAGLKWYNLAPCYLRECLAVLAMWVLT